MDIVCVRSGYVLLVLLLVCLISNASLQVDSQQDMAIKWFHSEYNYFFKPNLNDTTPPTILGVTVLPSTLKVGDPRAEIQAKVYDQNGIKVVYAEVGTRMNLMLHLPSVLGTLAGDNTVFILPRSMKKIKETVTALRAVLEKTKQV